MDDEKCHCGKEIMVWDDGFTRNLCLDCSLERCDVPDGEHLPSCMIPFRKWV